MMLNLFIHNFIWAIMVMIMGFGGVVTFLAILIALTHWLGAWGLVGLAVVILASIYAYAQTLEDSSED